jgi:hypothetical protein
MTNIVGFAGVHFDSVDTKATSASNAISTGYKITAGIWQSGPYYGAFAPPHVFKYFYLSGLGLLGCGPGASIELRSIGANASDASVKPYLHR